MLPCTQDHTKPPQIDSSYSFFNTFRLLWVILQAAQVREGFAPGLQLGRVGLLLNKELQRRGGQIIRKFHRKFKYFITSCLYEVCQHLAPAAPVV